MNEWKMNDKSAAAAAKNVKLFCSLAGLSLSKLTWAWVNSTRLFRLCAKGNCIGFVSVTLHAAKPPILLMCPIDPLAEPPINRDTGIYIQSRKMELLHLKKEKTKRKEKKTRNTIHSSKKADTKQKKDLLTLADTISVWWNSTSKRREIKIAFAEKPMRRMECRENVLIVVLFKPQLIYPWSSFSLSTLHTILCLLSVFFATRAVILIGVGFVILFFCRNRSNCHIFDWSNI